MPKKSFSSQLNAKFEEATEAPQSAEKAGNDEPATKAPGEAPTPLQEIEFKKYTTTIRTDQLKRLARAIGRFNYEHEIEVSKAAVIRMGLEMILDRIDADPDRFLGDLFEFEAEELRLNEDRKYSQAAGLEEYRRPRRE